MEHQKDLTEVLEEKFEQQQKNLSEAPVAEHQKDLTEVLEGKFEQQQKNLSDVAPVTEHQKDLTEVLEGKFEQQQKNLSEIGATTAGKDGEKEVVEKGLPMETSPYLNYTDVEDYKRQAYGTEGEHHEPKAGQGAGSTDAPTPAGADIPLTKKEEKAVKPH